MSTPIDVDRFPHGSSGLVPPGGVVLALTDDGEAERFAPVRRAAARLARDGRGSVVLFHTPPGAPPGGSGGARCFDPLATEPDAGAGNGRRHTGSRRRDLLRDPAVEVAAGGAPVRAWLSRLTGPAAIAEAVHATGASIVLVPAEPAHCRLAARAIDLTLSYYAARLDVPLVAVDRSGGAAVVRPLGPGARPTGGELVAPLHAPSRPFAATVAGAAR